MAKVRLPYQGGVAPWWVFENAAASLNAARKREDELLTKGPDSFPWEFAGLIGAVDTLLVELRDSGAAPCLDTLYPPHA